MNPNMPRRAEAKKRASVMVAAPDGCEEASTMSQETYIPCNRPARWRMQNVKYKTDTLRMCDFCADHNLRRGYENIGPYPSKAKQPKESTSEWIKKQNEKQTSNKKPIEKKAVAKKEDAKEPKAQSKISQEDLELLEADQSTIQNFKALIDKTIGQCVDKMQELEAIEEYAKNLKTEIHHLKQRVIPEVLASAGQTNWKAPDGTIVNVDLFVTGSLPRDPDRREAAMDWLVENGGADLIKHDISMKFGRHMQKEVDRVKAALQKIGVDFKDDLSVHAGTLGAFARERIVGGEDVPLDLLGLFAGRMAKVTLPRAKAEKEEQ